MTTEQLIKELEQYPSYVKVCDSNADEILSVTEKFDNSNSNTEHYIELDTIVKNI